MKRRDLFRSVGVFGAALALRSFAFETSEDSGAPVQLALFPWYAGPEGDPVGHVLLHVNHGGSIVLQVRLDQAEPDTDFDVRLCVGSDGVWETDDIGVLTTNENGEGSESCTAPIAEFAADNATEIDVQVLLVRPS